MAVFAGAAVPIILENAPLVLGAAAGASATVAGYFNSTTPQQIIKDARTVGTLITFFNSTPLLLLNSLVRGGTKLTPPITVPAPTKAQINEMLASIERASYGKSGGSEQDPGNNNKGSPYKKLVIGAAVVASTKSSNSPKRGLGVKLTDPASEVTIADFANGREQRVGDVVSGACLEDDHDRVRRKASRGVQAAAVGCLPSDDSTKIEYWIAKKDQIPSMESRELDEFLKGMPRWYKEDREKFLVLFQALPGKISLNNFYVRIWSESTIDLTKLGQKFKDFDRKIFNDLQANPETSNLVNRAKDGALLLLREKGLKDLYGPRSPIEYEKFMKENEAKIPAAWQAVKDLFLKMLEKSAGYETMIN